MPTLKRKKQRNSRKHFSYAILESKILLASVSIDSGVVSIIGTGGNDTVTVRNEGRNTIVADQGTNVFLIPTEEIVEINFFGQAGDDSLTFFAGLFPNLASVTFSGGVGNDLFSVAADVQNFSNVEVVAFGGNGRAKRHRYRARIGNQRAR